jgi:flap endonuclease-1
VIPWVWVSSDEILGAIAIDAPNYITRRTSVLMQKDKYRDRVPLEHLLIGFGLIRTALLNKVLPVLVFDGPPESLKREPNPELVARAHEVYSEYSQENDPYNEEVTKRLSGSPALRMYFAAEHLRDLGRAMGVPTVTAPSEAEMLCAAMCRDSLVKTVVSNDADALLFGSPHVTSHMELSRDRICRVTLRDLEDSLSLGLDQLRDLAVICGCDFNNEGIKGVGPHRGAVLLKRYGNLEAVLKAKGYGHSEREPLLLSREVFEQTAYMSLAGLDVVLRPPMISRLVSILLPCLGRQRSEDSADQMVAIWRDFGRHQATLEQWAQ